MNWICLFKLICVVFISKMVMENVENLPSKCLKCLNFTVQTLEFTFCFLLLRPDVKSTSACGILTSAVFAVLLLTCWFVWQRVGFLKFNLSSGGRVKTWKRRWFILTDNCLYYFEYTTVSAGWQMKALLRSCKACSCSVIGFICFPKDKEPRGIVPLENLSIREVEDSKKPVNLLFYKFPHLVQNQIETKQQQKNMESWQRT